MQPHTTMADLIQDIQNKKQCPICSEVVVNKKLHLNMHFGKNVDHPCQYCGKIFAHQDNLRTHECVPTVQDESGLTSPLSKRRLYQCALCPKTFQFYSWFMEHIPIHSKEPRYTCLYCPKTFKGVYSVWDHLVHNHPKLADDSTQVNEMNTPKRETKSALRQKATQTMKLAGHHREIPYKLPALLKNVNLYPRVALSLCLTEALSKM